ncbi:MAG: hypothetical protein KTR27_19630 [Leptolyngbyaceae cyanobacterium MAG.088]|nr:hypothetical protein [Leptolyngbyaceae cyanobacterium MAG.088]
MPQLLKSPPKTQTHNSPPQPAPPLHSVKKLGLWMLFWLCLLDVSINRLFPYPKKVNSTPSNLTRYFDYGRSIEGKLNRMVQKSVANSDVIIDSGWIDPKAWENLPQSPQGDDDLLLAEYGMSYSADALQALAEVDGKITMRSIGGASAPPNHSLAAFKADTQNQNADVVMIGILASSVNRMNSLSGMSWTYEHPTPYTYPYYYLNNQNDLEAIAPAITTADDFVDAFNRKDDNWQRLQTQMEQYDQAFDPFVFHHNLSDRSAIIRLIRRGWASRARSIGEKSLFTPESGFNPEAPEIKTLKAILTEFVTQVKNADQTPVILLLNNQGYGSSLYDVLAEHVNSLDALIVSTHEIVPAEDPKNFLGGSHFTPEANRKIGKVLQTKIRAEHPHKQAQEESK